MIKVPRTTGSASLETETRSVFKTKVVPPVLPFPLFPFPQATPLGELTLFLTDTGARFTGREGSRDLPREYKSWNIIGSSGKKARSFGKQVKNTW